MARKAKVVLKPEQTVVQAAAGTVTDTVLPQERVVTKQEFKTLAESQYAPEPEAKPEVEFVAFLGTGSYFPDINGRTVHVVFSPEKHYRFTTNLPAVIEWCDRKGFSRA
jgi:hypothetical protein